MSKNFLVIIFSLGLLISLAGCKKSPEEQINQTEITLGTDSSLKMDITVISNNEIKFEVPDEYISYLWRIDGGKDSKAKTNQYLLNTEKWDEKEDKYEYDNGKHEILVIVTTADGSYDSARATFAVQH